MVTIGEFSRMTHLSVKALRHYHDVGVLVPARVDSSNGYRQYDLAQLTDAHVVKRLRDLDMPLDDVLTVLNATAAGDRDRAIAAHLERMEGELTRTRAVVASLRELLETPARPFDVNLRQVDDLHTVATRATVAAEDIEEWSNATFAGLDSAAANVGIEASGPPGSLFSTEFFADGAGDVVAFVPVARPVMSAPSGYEPLTIAGGQFAETVHRGSYHDLDRTYGVVGGFVNDHRIGRDGPLREHYLVGPDHASDPADYRTQLLWPVES